MQEPGMLIKKIGKSQMRRVENAGMKCTSTWDLQVVITCTGEPW